MEENSLTCKQQVLTIVEVVLRGDLIGKIFFSPSEMVFFSVFPNTMAYENPQKKNSICHQFLFIPLLQYTWPNFMTQKRDIW